VPNVNIIIKYKASGNALGEMDVTFSRFRPALKQKEEKFRTCDLGE